MYTVARFFKPYTTTSSVKPPKRKFLPPRGDKDAKGAPRGATKGMVEAANEKEKEEKEKQKQKRKEQVRLIAA